MCEKPDILSSEIKSVLTGLNDPERMWWSDTKPEGDFSMFFTPSHKDTEIKELEAQLPEHKVNKVILYFSKKASSAKIFFIQPDCILMDRASMVEYMKELIDARI